MQVKQEIYTPVKSAGQVIRAERLAERGSLRPAPGWQPAHAEVLLQQR